MKISKCFSHNRQSKTYINQSGLIRGKMLPKHIHPTVAGLTIHQCLPCQISGNIITNDALNQNYNPQCTIKYEMNNRDNCHFKPLPGLRI